MIKNQWYIILESSEVRKGKIIGVVRLNMELVIWRQKDGSLSCLSDNCCHRGASLSIGKLCNESERVECPFHGFQFDKTGQCKLIPANGKVSVPPKTFKQKSYKVVEDSGFIHIWYGDDREEYPELPSFKDINFNNFSFKTHKSTWPVHYSRAVENQLDVVHIPFVHKKTIGRSYKTLVNGPVQNINNNQIEFWVYNEFDNGQTIKNSNELPVPDLTKQHLHFIFPNIWQNYITKNIRVFVAFVPIDEKNTKIYLRTYQNFLNIPVFKTIIDLIMRSFSKRILNEDKKVVITQKPIKTEHYMGEKLIKADLPIITYRKIRDKLKQN